METKTTVTILVGPAGTGKTHRCVSEVSQALQSKPSDHPLLFIAPRQATFQLERQILADSHIPGYTRLRIVSFERLAEHILSALGCAQCPVLSDEGQTMVLRAILHQRASRLRIFHPTARLPGFALELSGTLRELQQHGLSPAHLRTIAASLPNQARLKNKLEDLSLLFDSYLEWLNEHQLEDAGSLLALATNALRSVANPTSTCTTTAPHWACLWLDGFAELTPQEIDLLAALLPLCKKATMAFCAESFRTQLATWHSTWSIVGRTIQTLMARLKQIPEITIATEILPRHTQVGRFSSAPKLALLETAWESGQNTLPTTVTPKLLPTHGLPNPIRVIRCPTPECEASVAAREILRHVRIHGGRYRDTAVLLRSLDTHADVIRRVFTRYQIPFFLDRRESVSHHPLLEITRSALRTVALGWQHPDWMSVLKTELLPANDEGLDRLENEALAHGWDRNQWLGKTTQPGRQSHDAIQQLIRKIVEPFQQLASTMESQENKPSGQSIVRAIRRFYADLNIDKRLAEWSNERASALPGTLPPAQLHQTVWEQLNDLLDNVELAFTTTRLDLREWIAVLEAGFSSLTVGLIPPSLDQVLVGAVDRSRNPNLALVVVLGMNASLFPANPPKQGILSENDRSVLANHGFDLTTNERVHLAREKFFAYIAITRSSENLILTCAERDVGGRPLNPSPFISSIKRIFPGLAVEEFSPKADPSTALHPHELLPHLIATASKLPPNSLIGPGHLQLPTLDIAIQLASLPPKLQDSISPATAQTLYGPNTLTCSVSELEQFGQCPFKFFVSAGLRARERELLELDARNVGTFLHEALAEFHRKLSAAGSRWRDLEPQQARQFVSDVASETIRSYARELFRSGQDRSLTAPVLIRILEDFIEQCVTWMRTAYEFDPCAVEVAFGTTGATLPAWVIQINPHHSIALRGKIDRVDTCCDPITGSQWSVVIDYKLSENKFNAAHLAAGVQLQLPAYLAAFSSLAPGRLLPKTANCIPAGMFYVPLRGSESSASSRTEALSNAPANRAKAHTHRGRFRSDATPHLDRLHDKESPSGQFPPGRAKKPPRKYTDALSPEDFQNLLESVENIIREFGERILSGDAKVDPCALSASEVACDGCSYAPICRIDRSKHLYRQLAPPAQPRPCR